MIWRNKTKKASPYKGKASVWCDTFYFGRFFCSSSLLSRWLIWGSRCELWITETSLLNFLGCFKLRCHGEIILLSIWRWWSAWTSSFKARSALWSWEKALKISSRKTASEKTKKKIEFFFLFRRKSLARCSFGKFPPPLAPNQTSPVASCIHDILHRWREKYVFPIYFPWWFIYKRRNLIFLTTQLVMATP